MKIFLWDEDLVEVRKKWSSMSSKDKFKINIRRPVFLASMILPVSFFLICLVLTIEQFQKIINLFK